MAANGLADLSNFQWRKYTWRVTRGVHKGATQILFTTFSPYYRWHTSIKYSNDLSVSNDHLPLSPSVPSFIEGTSDLEQLTSLINRDGTWGPERTPWLLIRRASGSEDSWDDRSTRWAHVKLGWGGMTPSLTERVLNKGHADREREWSFSIFTSLRRSFL